MFDPSVYYPTLNAPYKSWSDAQLVNGSHYIFTCMKFNEFFLTMADEITTYGELSAGFGTLVSVAGNRDKNAVVAKDLGRLSLIEASISLGNSASKIAAGNFQALASAGIELRKRPQPLVLGTPSNLVITAGTAVGQLKTKIKLVKGARCYIVKYAIDPQTPDSQWVSVTCTTSRYLLTGLQSGAKYWIKVGAVGGKDQTTWSPSQLSPFVP